MVSNYQDKSRATIYRPKGFQMQTPAGFKSLNTYVRHVN
jgi:hypothetical protein